MRKLLFAPVVLLVVLLLGSMAYAESFTLRGGAWLAEGEATAGLTVPDWFTAEGSIAGDGTGFYLGGLAEVGAFGFTGFYGSLKTEPEVIITCGDGEPTTVELPEEVTLTGSAGTYHILAGYQLGPVYLGGGYAGVSHEATAVYTPDYYVSTESTRCFYGGMEVTGSVKGDGWALGAFGSWPLGERAELFGTVLYVPCADVTASGSLRCEGEARSFEFTDDGIQLTKDLNGTIFGFELGGSYRLNDTFGLEAGYRSFKLNTSYAYKADDCFPPDFQVDGETELGGFFLGCTVAF